MPKAHFPALHSIIGLILASLLISGCASTSEKTSSTTALREAELAPTTVESMQKLGSLAARGELAAVDAIEKKYEQLYQNIDWKDDDRTGSNLTLMRAAFTEMANAVKGSNANDAAFKSLLYATGKTKLNGFTSDAFGIAAAKGHQPSLDVLLNHNRHGMLLSSTVFALRKPAARGNQQAINFLVDVLSNDQLTPLWHGASTGLVAAANQGHEGAKRALEKFDAYEKERMKIRATQPQAVR